MTPVFLFSNSFKLNLEERHLACGFKCRPCNLIYFWETPLFVNEAQISCTKEYLSCFPDEYTHVYPYRYTWYICIAMMIYTSLQEYLYPLIQRKSILQNSLVINLTHTRTHNCKSIYGPRPCPIESRQI